MKRLLVFALAFALLLPFETAAQQYGSGLYGGGAHQGGVLPTCSFSANPASVSKGSASTLTWFTLRASSTSFSPDIGSTATSGSLSVSPTVSTTYVMTAIAGSSTATCQTTISVTAGAGPCINCGEDEDEEDTNEEGDYDGRSGGSGRRPTTRATSTTPLPSPATTTASTSSPSRFYFPRDLKEGASGSDVQLLQEYLNARGFALASAGPGAVGFETTFFGGLTKLAVIRFQNAHYADILAPAGLATGTGFFGPLTRMFVHRSEGTSPDMLAAAPGAMSTTACEAFTRPLYLNVEGDEVRRLQQFLATLPGIYPEARITGFFGPLTEAALRRFQVREGIIPTEGDSNGGMTGPITTKKLNELNGCR